MDRYMWLSAAWGSGLGLQATTGALSRLLSESAPRLSVYNKHSQLEAISGRQSLEKANCPRSDAMLGSCMGNIGQTIVKHMRTARVTR